MSNNNSFFENIPNFFSTRISKFKNKKHRYFRHDLLQRIRQLIKRKEVKIINVKGHTGSGKTSTIEELCTEAGHNTFFVRFPFTNFNFDDEEHLLKDIRETLLTSLENSPILNDQRGTDFENHSAKVFICYSSLDYEEANRLYDKLVNVNLDPWMDKRNIIPGENWKEAISQSLRSSDFILLLLSSTSVEKRGFFRKEIRWAIDYRDEMLPQDIYLIPVRLDECDLPEEISGHQWVNLYEDDGLERLITALKIGSKRRQLGRKPIQTHSAVDYSSISTCDAIFERLHADFPEKEVIVILDDFDHFINRSENGAVYSAFKSLLEKLVFELQFKVIILGQKSRETFISAISPRFSMSDIFEVVVEPYSQKKLVLATQEQLSHYIDFEEGVLEELVASTGGNLYCYQLLFDSVVRYLNTEKKKLFTHKDIEKVFDFVLKLEDRNDFLFFWNSIPLGLRLFLRMVIDPDDPSSYFQISDLALSKWSSIFPSKSDAIKVLNSLVQKGYLEERRFGNLYEYRPTVPLFTKWIIKKYPNLELAYIEFLEAVMPILRKHAYELLFGSPD